VIDVYRETVTLGSMPTNPIEWLPFIESLDRSGFYDVADELLVWVRAGSTHCQRAAQEMLNAILDEYKRLDRPLDRLVRQINSLLTQEGKG
jgi:hypothetical protein